MPDDTPARLVERLVAAERESGLTHRAFAKSIGLSESYWCHIRHRERISLKALAVILRARPELGMRVVNEMAERVA